ncbi:hypothetical protein ACJJTC_017004 [Scirpophaga incertulas]
MGFCMIEIIILHSTPSMDILGRSSMPVQAGSIQHPNSRTNHRSEGVGKSESSSRVAFTSDEIKFIRPFGEVTRGGAADRVFNLQPRRRRIGPRSKAPAPYYEVTESQRRDIVL